MVRPAVVVAWVVASLVVLVAAPAGADDTSTGDKLRILYSSRFTFTDDGLPLITVEIMGGRREVVLSAPGGVIVRPDGLGGSAVELSAGERWTVRAEATQPATIHEWTVVERFGPDDGSGVAAAVARWKARGLEARPIDIGTVFGVDGEVIDTRDVLLGVDPVPAPGGAERARAIARRFGVVTSVHRELVRRPAGTVLASSGGTRVKNPSVLWFAPRDPRQPITVDDVPTGTGGSQLTTGSETRRYWGSVYVTVGTDGQLVAVNAVPEDRLLAGLVPAEIFPGAPEAALEAQAIAARTELLQKIGRRNSTDPFLLCSTQQCQVYAGAGKEHPRTTKAVDKTRGVVMLRQGGGLVDARYSAACGGHGEDNDAIWGGDPDPALRGHPDGEGMTRIGDGDIRRFLAQPAKTSWCGRTRHGEGRVRWTQRLDARVLDQRVAEVYPAVGRVLRLEPLTRGISGRIRRLRIVGDKASAIADGDLHIRRLLGGLRSTLFAVDVEGPRSAPTAFVFSGAGFGHGVGMCQVGAIGMAEAGRSHGQILGHYYRGTHLRRLY
jgi:stage II sporulation protein D